MIDYSPSVSLALTPGDCLSLNPPESDLEGDPSISNWTTSFIDGRIAGTLQVHRSAILRACTTSSLNRLQDSRLSRTSIAFAPPWAAILVVTQWTMSLFSPNSGSFGFLPVMISISTTPKLYTSHFVLALEEYAYSENENRNSIKLLSFCLILINFVIKKLTRGQIAVSPSNDGGASRLVLGSGLQHLSDTEIGHLGLELGVEQYV